MSVDNFIEGFVLGHLAHTSFTRLCKADHFTFGFSSGDFYSEIEFAKPGEVLDRLDDYFLCGDYAAKKSLVIFLIYNEDFREIQAHRDIWDKHHLYISINPLNVRNFHHMDVCPFRCDFLETHRKWRSIESYAKTLSMIREFLLYITPMVVSNGVDDPDKFYLVPFLTAYGPPLFQSKRFSDRIESLKHRFYNIEYLTDELIMISDVRQFMNMEFDFSAPGLHSARLKHYGAARKAASAFWRAVVELGLINIPTKR
jgi:hypothetical protein